jgi:HEAT repeat protein
MVVEDLRHAVAELISGSDDRAEAATHKLAAMGERALDPLLALQSSQEDDHRWWATRALAALNTPLAGLALEQALKDDSPAVRQCAALALRHHPTPTAIPALIRALADDDRLAARLAADALTALGSLAIPALANALGSASPAARIEAVRALAAMEDPEAVPALYAAFQEGGSSLMEYWAEHGLQRLGLGMVYFSP